MSACQAAAQQEATRLRDDTLDQLLIESGVALGIMAVASVGLGWLMAGRVLSPLRTITATARRISARSLHQRIGMTGPDDELKELGDTFDQLLGRLDASFRAQRQFVANASHELRTPLARQRTVLEVALRDPRAIPPDQLSRLFQPFQRLEPGRARTGEPAGLGLGLTIVSAIAAAHGASLRAVTRAAGGLAVEVVFPQVGGGAQSGHGAGRVRGQPDAAPRSGRVPAPV